MVTIDSLKQRLYELEMLIVDKQSELILVHAKMREMQVAAHAHAHEEA